MLYLNTSAIEQLGIDWPACINVIADAVRCLAADDYAQPIKPYLRYRDPQNRIIAMPAFVGGNIDCAGIKWIASFPKNIDHNLPRAHCVVVLNDSRTGEPTTLCNTALISIIRTASVSGLMLNYYLKARRLSSIRIGIIGFGPIGRYHLTMCQACLGTTLDHVTIFDNRYVGTDDLDAGLSTPVTIAQSWEDAYRNSDIVITCTVADKPYIHLPPKPGALLLNVSLRDYETSIYDHASQSIVVDDWDEVCRENTDIEKMHTERGLQAKDTLSLADVVCQNGLASIPYDLPVMFNPMGMAVFDVAMTHYYAELARRKNAGQMLE